MSAFIQANTRVAVINYVTSSCGSYEYLLEYACSNCQFEFAVTERDNPKGEETTDIYDRPVPKTSVHANYNLGYKGTYKFVDNATRNRAKQTAKPTDIKITKHNKIIKEDYCITELNMNIKLI